MRSSFGDLQETIRSMPAGNVGETAKEAEISEANPPPPLQRPFDPATVPPPAPPPPPMRGIAEPAEAPGVATSPQLQTDKAEYVVWYGTNRRPNDYSDPGKGYSALRDNVVHYGSCRVFIPQSHKIGSIGSPWWKRLLTLTDDRLCLRSVNEFEQSAYWSGIAAQLAAIDVAERCAVVFVHGYNVSFQEAALRAAQIGFDLSVKGAMAFFRLAVAGIDARLSGRRGDDRGERRRHRRFHDRLCRKERRRCGAHHCATAWATAGYCAPSTGLRRRRSGALESHSGRSSSPLPMSMPMCSGS
jgi:hypothetical protein